MAKTSQPNATTLPVWARLVFILLGLVMWVLLLHIPLWLIPLVLLTFITVFLFLLPITIRQVVLDQMSGNLRFPRARAEDFPKLDRDTMAQYAAQMTAAGFVPTGDYAMEADSKRVPQAFARHFIHPEHHCLAEVNQIFPRNAKPLRVTCVLMSWFGTEGLEREDAVMPTARAPLADPSGAAPPAPPVRGYYYCTHNRKASSLNNMIRHERAMGTRLETTDVAELLRVHLERRQLVTAALGLPPESGDLEALYFAFNQRLREELGHRLSRRDPWTAFWGAIFKGKGPTEIWGELEGKIQK